MDIKTALPNVREGEQIQVVIHAVWGDTNPAEHLLVYQEEPAEAVNFTCRGTTLSYHCNDDADEEFMAGLAKFMALWADAWVPLE